MLFQLKGTGIELVVGAFFCDQIIVGAPFDDAAVIQHHNAVGIFDGGEAVGDDEHGAACHQLIHTILHQFFGTGIDGGSGFVQNHHRGIGYRCPGDGDQLPLTLGKAGTVAGQLRIIALGQAGDEIVGIGQLCGLDAGFVGGGEVAITDIIHHRAGEEVGFLQYHAQGTAQVGFSDLIDIDAVVADFAVSDVVEAVDKVSDGGLAGTGSTHEGDLLARVGIQGHIAQYLLFRDIAEIHIVHGDVALQLGIGEAAVTVGMLPGPMAGMGVCLGDGAVFCDMGIDQGHIAFVGLRLLIHQLEDPFCACQGHNDGIELHGDLVDGHIEIAGQDHKGHQAAQAQQRLAGNHSHAEDTADNGQNGILDITQIVIDGAHHIGEFAGGVGIGAKFFVSTVKIGFGGLFVVEYFDHLLTGDHFFNIAIEGAQGFLLADEILGGFASKEFSGEDHAENGDHRYDGEDPGLDQHGDQQHHQGGDGGNGLGNGHGDHLPQSIDVTGIAGHNIAGGVAVEITQGKGLHFGEHIVSQLLLDALGDPDHQKALQETGQYTHKEYAGKAHQEAENGGEVGGTGADHRQDIIIHQIAQGGGADGGHQRGGEDTQQHEENGQFVLQHIFEDSQDGLFGVFGLAAVAHHSGRCHYASPPFC